MFVGLDSGDGSDKHSLARTPDRGPMNAGVSHVSLLTLEGSGHCDRYLPLLALHIARRRSSPEAGSSFSSSIRAISRRRLTSDSAARLKRKSAI